LAFLLDTRESVLLVQTTYDHHRWHLPGGYVEALESPEDAVIRELKEELELTVEVLGLCCVAYKSYSSNISLVYRSRIVAGKPLADRKEIGAWGYFRAGAWPKGLSDRTKKLIDVSFANNLTTPVITFKHP